jgi:hypothetical protein
MWWGIFFLHCGIWGENLGSKQGPAEKTSRKRRIISQMNRAEIVDRIGLVAYKLLLLSHFLTSPGVPCFTTQANQNCSSKGILSWHWSASCSSFLPSSSEGLSSGWPSSGILVTLTGGTRESLPGKMLNDSNKPTRLHPLGTSSSKLCLRLLVLGLVVWWVPNELTRVMSPEWINTLACV